MPNAARKRDRIQRLRGIGMACYVESSGVAPSRFAGMLGARTGFFEAATIRVQPDGGIQALLGTHNHGQGHATTLAQILCTRLGVPLGKIDIVEGDTDLVPYGTGTFGSRSIAVGGSALDRAADKIIAKGKLIAAHLLEASAGDIDFADGIFAVAGTDRRMLVRGGRARGQCAAQFSAGDARAGPAGHRRLRSAGLRVQQRRPCLRGRRSIRQTGATRVVGYWGVDDVGTVINPMIVDGQIHGGDRAGPGSGAARTLPLRPQTASCCPARSWTTRCRAPAIFPSIESELDESQPCTHNPLGAKGCGEAGAIAAPAAIVSAVLDALSPLGVTEIEMPLTPETVWRAIAAARSSPVR